MDTFRLLRSSSNDVREVRLLNAVTGSDPRAALFPKTLSGYFDDPEALASALSCVNQAEGWYITLNPVVRDALSRASNGLIQGRSGCLTGDQDIKAREWLPIDLDSVRITGVSASEVEHDAAIALAENIADDLRALGFPEPIMADSGNGAHLLYRVDLPSDDGGLVQNLIGALAEKYSTAKVIVDKSVHNPARIWKLYGTPACKGSDTVDRPHRLSRVLKSPHPVSIVPEALLRSSLATWGQAMGNRAVVSMPAGPSHATTGKGAIQTALLEYQAQAAGVAAVTQPQVPSSAWEKTVVEVMTTYYPDTPPVEKPNGALVWSIDCPWCFKQGKGYVVQCPDGHGVASCHSTHCPANGKAKGWKDLLQLLTGEPMPVTGASGVHAAEPGPRDLAALQCHSWDDLLAIPDRDQEYVLDRMIPKGAAGILAAPPGLGKTMFVIQTMVGKATGLPVFGLETGAQEGCILVEFEQSPESIKHRVRAAICQQGTAWKESHAKHLKANFRLLTLPGPKEDDPIKAMASSLQDCLPDLEKVAKSLKKVAWVVVDTLGWVSESSAETDHLASRPLWSMALQFAQKYDCAFSFIHHTKKANAATQLSDRMSPEMLRGANSQEGNARVINQVGWLSGKELDQLGLAHGINPTREFGVLGLTKWNDGPLSEEWLLLRKSEAEGCGGCWELVPDGQERLGAMLNQTPRPPKPTQEEMVLKVVHAAIQAGQALTTRDIADKALGSPDKAASVRTILGRLKDKGKLDNAWKPAETTKGDK